MVEFFSLTTKTTVLLVVVLFGLVDLGVCLNRYVDSYETLNYRPVLDRRKRSLDPDDSGQDSSPLELRFRSHNRTFHLRLHPIDPNTDVFSDDHFLDVDGQFISSNQLRPNQFLYEGYLTNDPASRAYGSVIDGIFDGHIISGDGKYYTVEKAARYFDVGERPSHFHSMIYLDDHINHSKFRLKRDITGATMQDKAEDPRSYCGMSDGVVDNMRRVQESWVDSSSKEFSFKNDHYGDDTTLSFPYRYLNRTRRELKFKNAIKEVNGRRLYGVRTCTLYLQADQKLYDAIYFKEGNRNHIRTREEIVGLFYNHIKAVNQIYESTDFGGVQGLNFVIQRTSIYTKETCLHGKPAPGSDNPFCEENVDVSNYLNLNSQRNHSAFCLAYALTFRDFIGGTLGLAWVASPTFSTAGGICQIYQKYNEGQQGTAYRSLNTGIITLVNYGNRVPLRVSQLTMAHEIGHNFGSPHDQTADCQPGLPDGNFIMFASATSGDKVNNAKFSPCSVTSISQVLYEVLQQTPIDAQHSVLPMFGKKRNCFQERTSAFCGNQIREPGEQCDCGFSQHDCEEMGDRCCQPRENHQNPCKRTLHARCSPSEGLCCKASVCDFYTVGENQLCREESECLFKQFCNGQGAACPDSAHKPNGLPCQDVTKVCHGGSCNGSICAEVGLKDCFLTEGKPTQLCHLACEKNGTCYSSFDLPEFAAGRFHQLNRENAAGLLLHPGSPCNNYKGYCDILRKCRSVDSNGPLSRLKNLILNRENIKTISQWVQEHWWACVFIGIGVLFFMALFVKCCAVHTPSTNPNKIPAQHLSDTLRHPGTLLRRGRQPTRPPGHGAMPVPTSQPQPSGNAGQRAHRNRPNGQIAGNGQRANQRTAMPSASHHVSGNRVPPNLSAPPLIPPPPNSSQPVIVASSGVVINQQSTSPVHDPPPPYTPTDPAASTSATPLPTTAQSPVLIGGIASPVPTPVFLPGAPLPPPLVPGPPFPNQGPKPGRRRPKTQQDGQKKVGGKVSTPAKSQATGSSGSSAATPNGKNNNKRPVK